MHAVGVARAGEVLVSDAEATQLRLPDGSTLQVDRGTQLAVLRSEADDVQLRLEHGGLRAQVSERPGRRFTLAALDAQLEARSAGFRVQVLTAQPRDRALSVAVERGQLLLHHDGRRCHGSCAGTGPL